MEGIRETLIKKREALQMSLTQLARVSGVTYYQVKRFEDGENISADHIIKIAAGLGFTLERPTLAPEVLEKFVPRELPKEVKAGDKRWKWTILGPTKKNKEDHAYVLCECECEKHTLRYVEWKRIKGNHSTSCGCDRAAKIAASKIATTEIGRADTPMYAGVNLTGQMFNNGKLLALNAPPRLFENRWEWLCQCQVHDVPPKYFRITKLQSGEIKGCGCHGGSEKKEAPTLGGMRLGFIRVLYETREGKKGTEYLTQCVVCKTRKWVRASNLLNHTGISCRCVPKQLIGRKIGKYFVVDNRERKNDAGLPEVFCEKENGNNVWVSKERLLRTLADELVKEKKSTAHK